MPILLIFFILILTLVLWQRTEPFPYKNLTALCIPMVAVCLGLLQFPLSDDMNGQSEVRSYLDMTQNGHIPLVNFNDSSEPGFHVLGFISTKIIGFNPVFTIRFLRFIIFLLTLYSMRGLLLALIKRKDIAILNDPTSGLFLLSGVFFFAFDWNISFLLIGDEFRNELGNLFFIQFLNHLLTGNFVGLIILGLAACVTHKMYLFCVLIMVGISILKTTLDKFSRWQVLALCLFGTVFGVFSLKYIVANYLNYLSLNDKFNHPVPTGLLNAFLLRPGVLLATFYYGLILSLLFYFYEEIKKSKFLFTAGVLVLTGFVASKLNVFGERFVEPNRIYILMAPAVALLGAYGMVKVRRELKLVLLFLFLMCNFMFKNFTQQSGMPSLSIFDAEIFRTILDSVDRYPREFLILSGFFGIILTFNFLSKIKFSDLFKDVCLALILLGAACLTDFGVRAAILFGVSLLFGVTLSKGQAPVTLVNRVAALVLWCSIGFIVAAKKFHIAPLIALEPLLWVFLLISFCKTISIYLFDRTRKVVWS